MPDGDGGVRGRAVPSSSNSIDCDGVVSARLQIGDGGGGLSAEFRLPPTKIFMTVGACVTTAFVQRGKTASFS